MLRPVRMTLANVALLKEDEAAAVAVLAEMECLQTESGRLHKDGNALSGIDTHAAAVALEGLRSRMAQVAADLGLEESEAEDAEVRVDPRGIAAVLEGEFAPLEKEVRALSERISDGRKAQGKAVLVSWIVAGLQNAGVDVDTIVRAKYVAVDVGVLLSADFPRVKELYERAGHRIFRIGNLREKTLVCAVTQPERRQELADGLDAARFERIVIGKDLLFDGRPAAEINEEAMWEIEVGVEEAGLTLADLAGKHAQQVRKWRREVEVNIRLLASMETFLEGSYTCLISGWVPTERVEQLRDALRRRCAGPVEVFRIGEGITRTEQGTLEPPTLLRNAAFVRPFQMLVTFYGSPSYDGLDPTVFVAFTFAFIFGAMFGDVGHGLVLALAGLAAWYFDRKGGILRNAGGILMWCGTAATFFGFVYGSAFGIESEHWALWKPPMSDPKSFLIAGVLLGVLVINLGLIINLLQQVWARKYKEAIFGEWGGTTLVFYWGMVGMVCLSATGRGDVLTGGVIAAVLGPPLLATTFGSEIVDLIRGRHGEHELAKIFIRPMELMMSSMTNTMSFMRVAAFAINHGALMGTVWVFAKILGGPGAVGAASYWANVVMGNIMVICLEGVMVFVQVLRLHYYEFFSKFFHSQGRPFEPLSLKVRRSAL